MTRPCFALTVLVALLGISLSAVNKAHCQTLTDLYRCGSDYSGVCPFVDGVPGVEDEIPPTTEELDLRGRSVVAVLDDPCDQEVTVTDLQATKETQVATEAPIVSNEAAEDTYRYESYYEEAYRKYYDEAYRSHSAISNDADEQLVTVVDPEPANMAEAMQAYCSGYDTAYDATVYGVQPMPENDAPATCSDETSVPLCHAESSPCQTDAYVADENVANQYYDDEYYDDEYYAEYYGEYNGDDDPSVSVAQEDSPAETSPAAEDVQPDDACYGCYNYGPAYEEYYESNASSAANSAAVEPVDEAVAEPESWESEGYDYYDYREEYEAQYAQEAAQEMAATESEQPSADSWDEERHGYYDYAYPYGADAYEDSEAERYETTETAQEASESCEWDRDGDGFYDESPAPAEKPSDVADSARYEYDFYGSETAERYEVECPDQETAAVPETDEAYWDDAYYGYDYSFGDQEADTSAVVTDAEPAAESQPDTADYDAYEYDCDKYSEYVYDDYRHDECACPETDAVVTVSDVAQLGRDFVRSASQTELAAVVRSQADKLFVHVGSLISDANMEVVWQRLHRAAESEAIARSLHEPNVFVFCFEVDHVTKAELAGRGALVWAAQVLDRVGIACQGASQQLERLAATEFSRALLAQEQSNSQR